MSWRLLSELIPELSGACYRSRMGKRRRARVEVRPAGVGAATPERWAGVQPTTLLVVRLVLGCGLGYALVAAFPGIEQLAIRATLGTTTWALALVFRGVQATGDVISTSRTSIRIVSDCTPLTPLILLYAAIWAYPAGFGAKILGTIAGGCVLWVYNTVRIALLIDVLAHAPSVFDLVHVYLWQSLTVVVVTALFGWWIHVTGSGGRP
jgi:exosortase/archaeosortase family protein